jgi:hypothetical protein
MAAISTHPSLRMLEFREIQDKNQNDSSSSMKGDRTIAVAEMLKVNTQVDEIPFDIIRSTSNRNKVIAPRVESNLYRKRFPALQKIQLPSTRTAIVAMALARVASKPSLLWMILSRTPTFFATT